MIRGDLDQVRGPGLWGGGGSGDGGGVFTSNNRNFDCLIVCTDIYSQCYFVH